MITTSGQKLIDFLDEKMHTNNFTNEDLVQFIEAVGRYLNLQTIPDYAKEHKMSYTGVRDHRNVETIFNVKFVVENQ
jgi:hypothetical protein